MDYFVGKNFTHDWTSHNIKTWEKVLSGKRAEGAKVLEIGSFEGRSALFFLQYLPGSSLTCIDTFAGSVEHVDAGSVHYADMSAVERRFDENLKEFSGRIEKRKGGSLCELSRLLQEGREYDVVYVDGDHMSSAVFADATLAWRMLRPGGIMILDDYLWAPELPPEQRPASGIDALIRDIRGQSSILHSGYQMIVAKTAPSSGLKIGGKEVPGLELPKVSFILVNWNYGRYVGEAVRSIQDQDYENFECIIVDNGSSDESVEIIRSLVDGDRRFSVVELPENIGQLGAARLGLAKASGNFVTFVDSDDVLFPKFASTHVQLHLSVPRSLSFTSTNVAEIDGDGAALTSTYCTLNLDAKNARKGLRPASDVVRLSTVSDELFGRLHAQTASLPGWLKGWHWSPGTANMFRRSILTLLDFDGDIRPMMRSTDGHFMPLCHAFTGSAVCGVPMSAYRLHGSNYFANRESMPGLRNGTKQYADRSRQESYLTLGSLLAKSKDISWILSDRFWKVIDISTRTGTAQLWDYYAVPEAERAFSENARVLASSVGRRDFVKNIAARFPLKTAFRLIGKGLGRKARIGDYLRAAQHSRKNKARKLLH